MKHNSTGIVYLIQPSEYISTNIYKIGYSCQPHLNRIKQYGCNTYTIMIEACDNAFLTEKKIIDAFKSKFKIHKGKEYFIGEDIDMMKSVFRSVLNNGVKMEDNIATHVETGIATNIATNNETNVEMNLDVKSDKIYECKYCIYKTNRKHNFAIHNMSKKHIKQMERMKYEKKFNCEECNYHTNISSHYKRHLDSLKHAVNLKEHETNNIDNTNIKSLWTKEMFMEIIEQNDRVMKIIENNPSIYNYKV